MEPYQYTPFNSDLRSRSKSKPKRKSKDIRLLKLLPGNFLDPIRIELSHTVLKGYRWPRYEALSYAWGSRENQKEILVKTHIPGNRAVGELSEPELPDRHEAHQRLLVTSNLEEALRHLRRIDKPRTMWADAICINQSDAKERAIQVRLMGKIYHLAKKVVVWLGPSSDHTKDAFEAMRQTAKYVVPNWSQNIFDLGREAPAAEVRTLDRCYDCRYTKMTRLGLQDIFQRQWFTRLWVLQEICMSRATTVVCGQETMDWKLFSTAIGCIDDQLMWVEYDHHTGSDLQYEQLKETIRKVYNLAKQTNIVSSGSIKQIERTRYMKCEDPRDRIYAQLSIFPRKLAESMMVPSYSKTTTVSQVYSDAFLKISGYYKDLNILEACDKTAIKSEYSLPSWVPNWSVEPNCKMLAVDSIPRSSGYSKAVFEYLGGQTLKISGTQIDRISDVSKMAECSASSPDILALWQEWMLKDTSSGDDGEADKLAKYAEAVVCGELKERLPKYIGCVSLDEAKAILSNAIEESQTDFSASQKVYKSDVATYGRGRKLFTTSNGYIGLGPGGAQADDIVCVFLGLRLPIVLRPAGRETFEVVGSCYLPGFMDSEALFGNLPDNWCVEVRYAIPKKDFDVIFFINSESGEVTQKDPRLWELPEEWEDFLDEDGEICFRNTKTLREQYPDPRHTVEELKNHGIKLQEFKLI